MAWVGDASLIFTSNIDKIINTRWEMGAVFSLIFVSIMFSVQPAATAARRFNQARLVSYFPDEKIIPLKTPGSF